MAYQNVGTPRFYINVLEWLASNNAITLPSEHYRTLPVSMEEYQHWIAYPDDVALTFPRGSFNQNTFVALLGHKLSSGAAPSVYVGAGGAQTTFISPMVNVNQNYQNTTYNGFSIAGLNFTNFGELIFTCTPATDLGSIIFGTYYDMPHSSDLKMTMSYGEMDGVKRVRTKGGTDLVKHQYTKSPLWGSAAPWELYSGTPTKQELSRIGRRTWDLSFSYLSDGDLFPYVSSLSWFENYYHGSQTDASHPEGTPFQATEQHVTLMGASSNNFYPQVIHKTNGGQLPFIFQPDKDDNTNFAIAKFDQKSFSFQQTAPNLYSVKMKIREVW